MSQEYEITKSNIMDDGYSVTVVYTDDPNIPCEVKFKFTVNILNALDTNRADILINWIKDNVVGRAIAGEDVIDRLFTNLAHQRMLRILVKGLGEIEKLYSKLVMTDLDNYRFIEDYEDEINRKIGTLSPNKLEITTLKECIEYTLSEIGE